MRIKTVKAIEILDSRGNPTLRTFVILEDGSTHSSSIPSGASMGKYEALELRDNDPKRYSGQGTQKAVQLINNDLSKLIVGADVNAPSEIDQKLKEADGTENKSHYGANSLLSISQAVLKAAAYANKMSLWQFINQYYFSGITPQFPRIMVNIINGGKHAEWNFDIQEFMIVPNTNIPSQSLQIASEIFHELGRNLKKRLVSTLVGDEGGYSPLLLSNEDVLGIIVQSAQDCGFTNTNDYNIVLDVAASNLFVDGMYVLIKSNRTMKTDELMHYYLELQRKYSIYSFEDPFAEDDWDNFKEFTKIASNNFLIVGDDLYATNPNRIKIGIEKQVTNAILIKPNQIGTIIETVEAIRISRQAGWKIIVSHRSGETEDHFIADFAYAAGADFLKSGSVCRSERLSKYNRLIEIENKL